MENFGLVFQHTEVYEAMVDIVCLYFYGECLLCLWVLRNRLACTSVLIIVKAIKQKINPLYDFEKCSKNS